MKWQTGAYRIVNAVNGKVYVGGAYRSFAAREKLHRWALENGSHFNRGLQNAWNKYGATAFSFEVLERCPPDNVEGVEQKWLDRLQPWRRGVGYNVARTAGSMKGWVPSARTRRIWSAQRKGRVVTPETRAKLSAAGRGKKRSPEFCAKMSKVMAGNRNGVGRSPEALARIRSRPGNMLGKYHSEETKRKISEAGKGRTHTSDARARIGAAAKTHMRGNTNFKGKRHSPEARAKIAEAARRQWQDPKHRANVSAKNRAAALRQHAPKQGEMFGVD